MPSNQQRSSQGTKSTDDQKRSKMPAGRESDTAHDAHGGVADALDSAAESVQGAKDRVPAPLAATADQAAEGLGQAATYIRDHNPAEIADDVWHIAKDHPIPSMLIAAGLIVGGGYLLANAARHQDWPKDLGASSSTGAQGVLSSPQGVSSSVPHLLGPKANQMALRVRDAVVSLALAKLVDAVEDRFPGFREHFDKA